MILLTPYYLDSRPERQAELDFCLQQNLQNPFITKVILFLDYSLNAQQTQALHRSKIETFLCDGRCTYQNCLDYANKYLQGEIVIVANTDIFFDETVELLVEHDLSNQFINLSRWEVVEIDESVVHSQLRASIGSQDAWIFRAPLKPFVACFPLGKPGCDNRIAFEASTVGLCVTNPAFSIRSHHLHLTNIRNYNNQDRISGPYLLMPPEYLADNLGEENPSYIYMRGDGRDDMALLNSRAEQLLRGLPKTADCEIPYCQSEGFVNSPDRHNMAKLTAVIIVRDPGKTIDIALTSLEGCYDQLVIIDVGDAGKMLTTRYDARITQAQEGQELQAILHTIEGGWIFQLEADEFIDEQSCRFLKQFKEEFAHLKGGTDSYLIQRRWISPWETTSFLINNAHAFDLQLRLFRRSEKLFLAKKDSSFIHGFQELGTDLDCIRIYSLYLTVNERSVRQQKSLYSSWFESRGETLQLCMPELRKMQVARLDSNLLSPTVNALLQSLEAVNPDQQLPLMPPAQKAYPVIVIDGVFFQFAKSGISRLWETLLKEWVKLGFAPHLVIIDRGGATPKFSGVTYRTAPCYDYAQLIMGREFNEQVCQEEQASLFISTYYTTPLNCRSVFMVYDMIPEVQDCWDLSMPVWQAKRHAIGHASAYIAISKSTANDLIRLFPHIDPSVVNVAYCGVECHFQPASSEQITSFKTTWGVTKPYFLIVGTRFQYKNFLLFLLAFSNLPNREAFSIVCVGGGTLEEYFQIFAGQFSIHMLNLSDQELAVAYSAAEALVYPSIYEGFGMPVAEAMACGCPVITCRNSSLPEVAGKAALYVGESDVEGMMRALLQVQQPATRQKLAQAGLEQVRQFSWTRMAEDVARVLLKATLPIVPACENHLLFPDWRQPNIAEALTETLCAWIAQAPASQIALLIAAEGFPLESGVETFLQSLLAEIFLNRGQVLENPMHCLPALYPVQWQILLKEHCTYVPMEMENRALVIDIGANQLPRLHLPVTQSVV